MGVLITQGPSTSSGSTDFADDVFRVHDDGDATKKLAFDVGTQLGTATTRTLQIKDADGIIALENKSNTWTGGQQFYDVDGGGVINIGSAAFPVAMMTLADGGAGGGSYEIQAAATTVANVYGIRFNQTGSQAIVTVVGADGITSPSDAVPDGITSLDATAQSAAIAATKLLDNTSGIFSGRLFSIHYTLEDTTTQVGAATVQFQIDYTDDIGATTQAGAAITLTVTGRDRGSFQVYLASGNITYQTNVTGVIAAGRYALHVRCEYLG